jgi:hypothetical protein
VTWVDLSRLRLNTCLVAYLHRCADAIGQGRALPAPAVRPSVYTAPKRHLRDRPTADEVEQLLADYRAGVPRRNLAQRYGISISSLARLVRRRGLRRRRKGFGSGAESRSSS